jgi:hypothetical protein
MPLARSLRYQIRKETDRRQKAAPIDPSPWNSSGTSISTGTVHPGNVKIAALLT